MPLRGWKPITGDSARRYQNTRTGEIISRRTYDDKRAQAAGWRNRYEVEKFRTNVIARTRWGDWQYDVKQHTGRLPSWELYHDVQEVRERRRILADKYPHLDSGDRDKHDPELVAANGPLARVLDAAGRRPLNGRPVGDS
jgi:hypothetical protein